MKIREGEGMERTKTEVRVTEVNFGGTTVVLKVWTAKIKKVTRRVETEASGRDQISQKT